MRGEAQVLQTLSTWIWVSMESMSLWDADHTDPALHFVLTRPPLGYLVTTTAISEIVVGDGWVTSLWSVETAPSADMHGE